MESMENFPSADARGTKIAKPFVHLGLTIFARKERELPTEYALRYSSTYLSSSTIAY